jgi:aspartate/methionine/tyrosine aminotransferase
MWSPLQGLLKQAHAQPYNPPPQDVSTCIDEWQRRRDVVCEQLRGFPIYPAAGGWPLLLEVAPLGYDSFTASRLLLERGKIATTPMRDWGNVYSDQFVRLVFSNEPVHRLGTLRERVAGVFPPA